MAKTFDGKPIKAGDKLWELRTNDGRKTWRRVRVEVAKVKQRYAAVKLVGQNGFWHALTMGDNRFFSTHQAADAEIRRRERAAANDR